MHWLLGNGRPIKFWLFNWATDMPLISLIPHQLQSSINADCVVADFISDGNWGLHALHDLLPIDVLEKIFAVTQLEDSFY